MTLNASEPDEKQLAQLLHDNRTSLTREQITLAEAQHHCRTLRGATHACAAIRTDISGACATCLLLAFPGTNQSCPEQFY